MHARRIEPQSRDAPPHAPSPFRCAAPCFDATSARGQPNSREPFVKREAAAFLLVAAVLSHPLAAQEAAPCAQPILSTLRFLEGSWSIQSRARLSANPTDWESGAATATIESVMRDCAFIERYAGTRRGQPFETIHIFGAMESGAGLRLVLADSEHGPLFVFDGGPEADGVVFYSEVTTPQGKVRLRLRFGDIGADSFVTESQRSLDGGKTWDTTGHAEYRRRVQ